MSLWTRMFGRRRPSADDAIAALRKIAQIARDRKEFRELVVKAARAGDLDDAFAVFGRANRRAEDYVANG